MAAAAMGAPCEGQGERGTDSTVADMLAGYDVFVLLLELFFIFIFGVYSYSVGARCLLCWGVIGLFVTDCAIPMDSLFLVLGGDSGRQIKRKDVNTIFGLGKKRKKRKAV